MLRNLRYAQLFFFLIATCAFGAYPERPVRFIVAGVAGGTIDISGRVIATQLTKQMGQEFVVDNRPGGSQTIGTSLLARARADGYTIGHGNVLNLAINRSVFAKLPYDPERDLQPIALTLRSFNMLTTSLELPVKSVPELIDYAKRNPSQLIYAVGAIGSSPHLTGELFKQLTGIQMRTVIIPAPQALAVVVMGQAHVWIQGITVLEQHVKMGRIRGLAVTGLRRSPSFPDLPTVAESGLPGFEVAPWGGVVAPTGVPKAIVTRLNAEINKALATPAVQEKFLPLGVEVFGSTPEQFADHIRKETVKWADVVRRAGIQPQ
jgi:tripartite-type tricarboxylate transporter receptor subunit TctC